MTPAPLVPAELAFAGDGVPFAPAYDDLYHSAQGGLAQAHHVFLAGNDLPERWRGRASFAIVETGFGLGLNFLVTWQAWKDDPRRPERLHYFSVEKHPFRRDDLARLHAAFPEIAPLAARLRAAWPSLVSGFHRLHFENGRVALTLVFGAARSAIAAIGGRFDAFYLDGFAPEKNPEMWSAALIDDLAWLAAPGATLATWTSAGDVRRRLASADFAVEKRAGFGNKREMLAATHPGAAHAGAAAAPPRRIAVIGAGIAGIACAERLAARGCEVALFERRGAICAETSGNRQAILLPVLAVDETRLARLNRVAFLHVLHRLRTLEEAGHPVVWDQCGVFQIARDTAHAQKQQAIVRDQRLPEDFAQCLAAAAAAELVGAPVAGPGWWFPQAGWLSPTSLA
ncbi:MAG: tRNA (5-methylaminomethyl-2-thiouridine)(34)-methyltransferase MnmD, partial [Sulfuritalea sp.]|nr:tRNA (5-methylaminomethyl-2-thiouridine)(34)-methyltransferase MnmD [Sulfuritalea sp.]